ncbi:MAG: exosortase-associated EpsI family protein [Gemmataceae bacterium]
MPRRPPTRAVSPPPLSRGAAAVLVALVLGGLVAAAVFEGVLSNRWGVPEDLEAAAARLGRVPSAFGDWTSEEVSVDRKILDRAEAVGSVSRVYRNRKTGSSVSVMILCGPTGPIASHTPDVCYAGLGYKMQGGEVKKSLGDATYWTARFDKGSADPGLEVNWAWGANNTWYAAATPRLDFTGHAFLYKIYATRSLAAGTTRTGDPGHEFLAEFLPVLRVALDPG